MPQHTQFVEQVIWQKEDAHAKLKDMDLEAGKLIRAAIAAIGQANNVTRNFATNAWGTFAYHYGLAELRNQFVGPHWRIDRSEGIESIVNDAKMLKVTFQNVDIAMGKDDPKPRSPKGAGAERACEGNLDLFPDYPVYVPVVAEKHELWSLMVDDSGNIELSRPVVLKGTFVCGERVFIADADDWMDVDRTPSYDAGGDAADDFEVEVSRKLSK